MKEPVVVVEFRGTVAANLPELVWRVESYLREIAPRSPLPPGFVVAARYEAVQAAGRPVE